MGGVRYTGVIPLLVEAMKELDEKAKLLDLFDEIDESSLNDSSEYDDGNERWTYLEEIVNGFFSRRRTLEHTNEKLLSRIYRLESIIASLGAKAYEQNIEEVVYPLEHQIPAGDA